METQFFKSERVSERITRIRGIAGELMYLVEGTEEAFLIDTGVGIGNLKKFLKTLTDKKVTVLQPHFQWGFLHQNGVLRHLMYVNTIRSIGWKQEKRPFLQNKNMFVKVLEHSPEEEQNEDVSKKSPERRRGCVCDID